MDAQQIAGLGPRLTDFLLEFADCLARSEPREHLRTYVGGQLSDLPRKSVEPIALDAGAPPRTLPRFHIKDGENGPMIRGVKHAPFFRKRGDGLPGPAGCWIVARHVLNPDEVKYFVSNRCPGSGGVTIDGLLWVGFSRWPIERCFEQAKNEWGMDPFEVRGWRSIHRHLYITQRSHVFCARVHQQLREKNDADALPDGGTSPPGRLDVPPSVITTTRRATGGVRENGLPRRLVPTPQPTGWTNAHPNHPTTPAETRHQTSSTPLPCAA